MVRETSWFPLSEPQSPLLAPFLGSTNSAPFCPRACTSVLDCPWPLVPIPVRVPCPCPKSLPPALRLPWVPSPPGGPSSSGTGISHSHTLPALSRRCGWGDLGTLTLGLFGTQDLVKSHLMFAVREEVEVLKEQIRDLAERNAALEQENGLLRALASPEQLAQLPSSGLPRLGPPAPNGPSL